LHLAAHSPHWRAASLSLFPSNAIVGLQTTKRNSTYHSQNCCPQPDLTSTRQVAHSHNTHPRARPYVRRASSPPHSLSHQIAHLEGKSAKGAPHRRDVRNCFKGTPAARPRRRLESAPHWRLQMGLYARKHGQWLTETAEYLRAPGYVDAAHAHQTITHSPQATTLSSTPIGRPTRPQRQSRSLSRGSASATAPMPHGPRPRGPATRTAPPRKLAARTRTVRRHEQHWRTPHSFPEYNCMDRANRRQPSGIAASVRIRTVAEDQAVSTACLPPPTLTDIPRRTRWKRRAWRRGPR
jgi:hypothetical protein